MARQLASLLGLDIHDQTRLATAVSEIARNALKYAGGGKAQFFIEATAPPRLRVIISDKGPGIAKLAAVLDGEYRSPDGMGLGLVGTKRLMDEFHVETTRGGGSTVSFAKRLPLAEAPGPAQLAELSRQLGESRDRDPFEEIRDQNLELLRTLDELRQKQSELSHLNRELEETNQGVVALYRELDEKSRSLQKASEVKSRFLSHMSHEFRTPVFSILALCGILIDRSDGELTPEQEKQVRFVQRAAESLQEMVNDLLDLAKVESGKIAVRATEFLVADLFSALRGMLRPLLARSTAVSLSFDEEPGLPPIYTDEGKVAQILRNFISNAIKYTEHGEIRVQARLADESTLELSVSDTGIGIAPENQAVIFEEFIQVDGPHQDRVKGTGLGLPLTRKLARLLGGEVGVTSAPGEGSTFLVSVPVRYAGDVEPVTDSDRNTILVIDDDEVSRYLLSEVLKETGYRLIEAANGVEGIGLARAAHPSAVFLDLIMPEMDGFAVLRALRGDPQTRDIPVIVHSTLHVAGPERALLERDAVTVLHKDFSQREAARSAIQAALAEARALSGGVHG